VPLTAVTVEGTSWIFSARRWAVTTTAPSWRLGVSGAAWLAAGVGVLSAGAALLSPAPATTVLLAAGAAAAGVVLTGVAGVTLPVPGVTGALSASAAGASASRRVAPPTAARAWRMPKANGLT